MKMDKDGSLREIQPERQDVRHAYALTTHKAQGMTVEKAVVYIQGANMSREMNYVQASRAKGGTEFVTTRTQVEKLARDAPPSRETAAMVQACGVRPADISPLINHDRRQREGRETASHRVVEKVECYLRDRETGIR
ncbi:MAG: hypothetical protein KJ558_10315 [Gammaproteobacteria bacterium]|nr:hypothetical protein [Gammaproteobacteria bacterium]MBU1655201.1 hypothetical protein [Gammaproteobacteria bacterium]MBU1962800.1 hypothetical protein [Gammaproteobacteria bacterium]